MAKKRPYQPGVCVCCLQPVRVDRTGSCSPCRARHRCAYCGAVTATCSFPSNGCDECRRIMAEQHAALEAIEAREQRQRDAGFAFPVCHDPRRVRRLVSESDQTNPSGAIREPD